MDTPIIEFSGVGFSHMPEKPLFKDVSVRFNPHSFNLIQGASGCGKTTFLRLMNRMEKPLAGEILFKGKPLSSYPPPLLRRSVLLLQQIPTVIDGTVADNLLLPYKFKNNRDLDKPDNNRLTSLLEDFCLQGVDLKDNARTLSVGQLQRVCFVRAMLLSPEVLLLDEPASALDEESCRIVEQTAEMLCRDKGLTVFMVSHRRFRPKEIRPFLFTIEKEALRETKWNLA